MVLGVVLKLDGVSLNDRDAHEGLALHKITDRDRLAIGSITYISKVPGDRLGQGVGILGWKQGTRRHPSVDMRKSDAAIGGGVEQDIFV